MRLSHSYFFVKAHNTPSLWGLLCLNYPKSSMCSYRPGLTVEAAMTESILHIHTAGKSPCVVLTPKVAAVFQLVPSGCVLLTAAPEVDVSPDR